VGDEVRLLGMVSGDRGKSEPENDEKTEAWTREHGPISDWAGGSVWREVAETSTPPTADWWVE
jgi:hypothetical protein